MGKQPPAQEVENGAGVEERNIQIKMLVLEERVGFDRGFVRPDIELGNADENRNEERGQPGNGARGGFGDTADDDTPSAAAQVLQHEQSETSERQAEIEEIGKQVG